MQAVVSGLCDPTSGGSRSPSARRRPAFSGPGGLTYVTLETPRDPDRVSSFLNIRVRDVQAIYAEWSARGAHFLTPPKQHQDEIRCYMRDPDGYLIEVGQTTDPQGDWTPERWPSSTAADASR
jgi:catechol 2,3-dioxygenase-like lactoylglutathione lyase family enzyme